MCYNWSSLVIQSLQKDTTLKWDLKKGERETMSTEEIYEIVTRC